MPNKGQNIVAVAVAAGAVVMVYVTTAILWVDGWVAAMRAVLHTNSVPAILAVVAAIFLVHSLLVLGFVEEYFLRDCEEVIQ